jgi:pSer/pThr/pTyr-binding forkhead associated (FHA) protein
MAKIYIKFNSAVIKEVRLQKDETTIGRKPTNDIAIDHPTISGFHAKIRKENDRFLIEDLNSTNGSFLNGKRIKSGELKDKDQIGIAGHILEFHSHDLSVPLGTENAPTQMPNPEVEKQKEMLKKSLGLGDDGKPLRVLEPATKIPPSSDSPASKDGKSSEPVTGFVRIIAGGVNGQNEVQLKELVTYIGTTDQASIKIKGFLAPSLAAAISKRPDGFFLKAVKPGYPKVNGVAVQEQVFLENGALIETGGTNMVFYRSDAKKPAEEKK